MAKKKKKGPAPRVKDEPKKKKKSLSQIAFSIFAVFMVILMVGPYILSLFQ